MKKNHMPVLIVCVLIVVVSLVGAGTFFIQKYIPTKEQMDLNQYYGQVGENESALVLGTSVLEQRGAMADGQAYLPLDVVNTYLNQRFYWDSASQQILYATPSQLNSYPASETAGTEVWLQDGAVYLSLPFVTQYTDIESYVYENPARVAIQYQFSDIRTVTVTKDSYVRYQGGIKSPVLTPVSKGTALRLMEELEEWAQVATEDGYIGYIEKKKISAPAVQNADREVNQEQYTYLTMEEPVNMAWHQVTSQEANTYLADAVQNVSGVNVISPTWFYLLDTQGNISNIASKDYVDQAHSMGMQVWGLIDNFTVEVSTTETLASTAARQNIINQLISAAAAVGLDGINVDFESLSEDVGVHFLQFLRELSIECHKNNLILSVDNPVPEDFTSHYDRAEQGRVVDYVIIMGYDEHYAGSEQAGSVASLPWVEKGIQDTIAEVPAERVINGIPFYTRLWKTSAGILSSEAIGMDQAQEVLSVHQVETYWDKNTSQNYGTYDSEGATYQIWLEDAQSLAEKVKLVPKYGLAGVAAWKLGFENSSVWAAISENLQ